MNFAILLNNAPDYRPFFCNLGEALVKYGHKVIFILDSHLSDFTYPDSKKTLPSYYFTDYAKENFSSDIKLTSYKKINLWAMYTSDFERGMHFGIFKKKKKSYHEKIIATLLNFFTDILLTEKIDAVIYENVSNTFSYAAYIVAQKHKIDYLGITDSRLEGKHHLVISSLTLSPQVAVLYEKLLSNKVTPDMETDLEAENYLTNLINIQPGYMTYNGLGYDANIFSRYFNIKKLKLFWVYTQYILKFKEEMYYSFQAGNPFKASLKAIIHNFKRKFKLKVIGKYITNKENVKQDYLLYPLHFHPESSTSIQARHYLDEYNVIFNISQNLPFGKCLFVKDHPSAAGSPPLSFYKKIAELPNVFLIDCRENAKKLAQSSMGIITLTSTLGFEALMLGKPVILLGDEFYEIHPNCIKLKNFDELHNILLSEKFNEDTSLIQKKSKPLLLAYIMTAKTGALDYRKNYDSSELLNVLCKEIQEYKNET